MDSPLLHVGPRELRLVHAAGVCLLVRRGAAGGVKVLAVGEADTLAAAARSGAPWFREGLGAGAEEALVLLERAPEVRARLARRLRRALLETAGPGPSLFSLSPRSRRFMTGVDERPRALRLRDPDQRLASGAGPRHHDPLA